MKTSLHVFIITLMGLSLLTGEIVAGTQEQHSLFSIAISGDIDIGILKNRLRIGVGTRDFDRASDAGFITFGVTDIPGMIYWLTR